MVATRPQPMRVTAQAVASAYHRLCHMEWRITMSWRYSSFISFTHAERHSDQELTITPQSMPPCRRRTGSHVWRKIRFTISVLEKTLRNDNHIARQDGHIGVDLPVPDQIRNTHTILMLYAAHVTHQRRPVAGREIGDAAHRDHDIEKGHVGAIGNGRR